MLNFLIFLTAFSQIYLNRFSLNLFSDFSLSFSYIFLYGALFIAVLRRFLVIDFFPLMLFFLFCFSAFLSYIFGVSEKTLSSLLLVFFTYFPFTFSPVSTSTPNNSFFALYFWNVLFLGVAGLSQFFTQFFFQADWLFDYRPLLPDLIRNLNQMNTVITIGGIRKSNGFFLLEPSFFSQWMAFGLLFFGLFNTSYASALIFLLGLLCSFSGTGFILVLFIYSLSFWFFTWNKRLFFTGFLFVFFLASILLPDFFLRARLEEFSAGTGIRTSSAAARFLSPAVMLQESWSISPARALLGHGPGTIFKVRRDFESHDPVWAKILFEYGFLGFGCLLGFLFFSIRKEKDSFIFTILFFVQWFFLGGYFLNFDIVSFYIVYYKLSQLFKNRRFN